MRKSIARFLKRSIEFEARLESRPRINSPLFTKRKPDDTRWIIQPEFVFGIEVLRSVDDAD